MARGEGPVYGYIQLPCKVELSARHHSPSPLEGASRIA
jgi:hypothetical protein